MKLLYNLQDGRIFYSVYDADLFKFTHTTNIPLEIFEIDEVDPENKAICLDLKKYGNTHRVDINGDNKYYMQYNSTAGMWELHERDNWEEYFEEFI